MKYRIAVKELNNEFTKYECQKNTFQMDSWMSALKVWGVFALLALLYHLKGFVIFESSAIVIGAIAYFIYMHKKGDWEVMGSIKPVPIPIGTSEKFVPAIFNTRTEAERYIGNSIKNKAKKEKIKHEESVKSIVYEKYP